MKQIWNRLKKHYNILEENVYMKQYSSTLCMYEIGICVCVLCIQIIGMLKDTEPNWIVKSALKGR